jgi:hypothetical protein
MKIKITFGIIVLNGEPFIRYNLRSLYPHAHQIIVVEGACRSAASVATAHGHSIDGTIQTLSRFLELEDPDKKVSIVTAQDEGYSDGFWPEKDAMSKAYAQRATGNYLWQVDSDEFYREEDVVKLICLLQTETPDAVSFPTITFWGGLRYVVDGFYLIRDNAREYHRLFAWGDGYKYISHFPPTVIDSYGIDLRMKKWIRAKDLEKKTIYLYHYSLLFPLQVFNKVCYYKNRNKSAIGAWEESVYRRLEKPYRAHNVYWHIGWLQRYSGRHPLMIEEMMREIESGMLAVETRNCYDVELLLSDWRYRGATGFLRICANLLRLKPILFFYRVYYWLMDRGKRLVHSLRTAVHPQ